MPPKIKDDKEERDKSYEELEEVATKLSSISEANEALEKRIRENLMKREANLEKAIGRLSRSIGGQSTRVAQDLGLARKEHGASFFPLFPAPSFFPLFPTRACSACAATRPADAHVREAGEWTDAEVVKASEDGSTGSCAASARSPRSCTHGTTRRLSCRATP